MAASYRFGAVWDGEKVHKGVCINTREERIESIGVCGANAVDLSRFTAIPGLIDVHTHMTVLLKNPVSSAGRGAAVVFLAQENARKTLETGVTSVRDLNAGNYADVAMRDLIASGAMKGPRMFVSGGGLFRRPGDPAISVEDADADGGGTGEGGGGLAQDVWVDWFGAGCDRGADVFV